MHKIISSIVTSFLFVSSLISMDTVTVGSLKNEQYQLIKEFRARIGQLVSEGRRGILSGVPLALAAQNIKNDYEANKMNSNSDNLKTKREYDQLSLSLNTLFEIAVAKLNAEANELLMALNYPLTTGQIEQLITRRDLARQQYDILLATNPALQPQLQATHQSLQRLYQL